MSLHQPIDYFCLVFFESKNLALFLGILVLLFHIQGRDLGRAQSYLFFLNGRQTDLINELLTHIDFFFVPSHFVQLVAQLISDIDLILKHFSIRAIFHLDFILFFQPTVLAILLVSQHFCALLRFNLLLLLRELQHIMQRLKQVSFYL